MYSSSNECRPFVAGVVVGEGAGLEATGGERIVSDNTEERAWFVFGRVFGGAEAGRGGGRGTVGTGGEGYRHTVETDRMETEAQQLNVQGV